MLFLEFTVARRPVSHQSKNKTSLNSWRTAVRAGAAAALGAKPLAIGRLKCTIINFHEGIQAPLDDDNMVKPIRDAMNGLAYDDDRQITHSETIQIGIDEPIKIRRATAALLAAFHKGDAFVYVRIESAPEFIQLPL
jgi:crossover junction endodeoxyribonuclease RusA